MEKSWKDILKEGEEAYNPQAWENVSRRLDQSMPVKGKGFSPKNWFLGGSAALVIGIGTYFLMNQDEPEKAQSATEEKNEQVTQNQLPSVSGKENEKAETNTLSPDTKPGKENGKAGRSSGPLGENPEKNEYTGPQLKEYAEYKEQELIVSDPVTFNKKFILPKHASEYCVNDEAELQNTNENRCVITHESGTVIASLAGNSKTKVLLTKSGTYYFRYPKFDTKNLEISEQEKAFVVSGPQTPDFSYDNEINYDNGIPYISLKTRDFEPGMSWSSDKGEIAEQAENTRLSVFRKGDYRIYLEKKDQQGCVAKKAQTITIRDEYNLLAPTAFRPSSNDPRNNRFMPFALSQRNTTFELVIIDPETGRTIFKSSSAENSWDGTDMNSEQSDKANKSYIWKVKLNYPERGEKSEYSGTILRLIQ